MHANAQLIERFYAVLGQRGWDARFEFRDGLILRHVDRFPFWTWARQALGTPGLLLSWPGFLRGKVRARAASSLADFKRKVQAG